MKRKLLVRNLVHISWLLTAITSTIVFLFLLTGQKTMDAVIFFLMAVVVIGLISFADFFILLFLYRWLGNGHLHNKVYRYCIIALLVHLLVWPVFVPLIHQKIDPYSFVHFLVFVISSALVNSFIIIVHNYILLMHEKAQSDLELANIKMCWRFAPKIPTKTAVGIRVRAFTAMYGCCQLDHQDDLLFGSIV